MSTDLDEMNRMRAFRRCAPSTLRGAWWAMRSVRKVRRELPVQGVHASVTPPPNVPWGARTGVYGVLNRLEPNCIERGLIMQEWLHAHGIDRDVVVGVRVGGPDSGSAAQTVSAHAWVDGVRDVDALLYTEIHRIPAGGDVRRGRRTADSDESPLAD